MTVDTTEIVGQIRAGNAIGVSLYLRKGGDPDARNHHGWTLLQLAAAEGQGEVVKVLLEANAKVNCCTTDMCTPLHRCATHGYKQVAQYLLEKGAYINAQDKAGNTPLHEAAKGLHTSIIKLLIDHKADVTRVNKKNQTFTDMVGQQIMSTVESGDTEILAQWLDWNLNPNTVGTLHWSLLHHACARGQFEVANLLLERGANVNCVDSNRNTPLHITSQHGHVQIAKLLIDKGANLNAQEQMGNTPLYSAVLGGHPDMICLLLERGIDHTIINKEGVLFTHLVNEFLVNAVMAGDAKTVQGLLKGMADPNSRDPYGMPVLCYAAFKGYLEVTEALLDYGADPNVSDTYLEKTPLHQAASGGHLFVAKALLDKKAHTNAKDKSGAMPLHDAAREGMEDTMSILMGRGAPLNATDADGNTPLHMAAKWGHTEAVEKLVDSGADETIKNKSGNVYSDLALFRAVRTGEQSEVTSGLAWGGDPNCRDSRGWTLLHHAVYKDSLSITQVLLECGAYVDAGDDHGRTPLLLAAYRGSTDIVEVLLDAGANVDARDWHGNTPLHWAAREGSIDTVQLLLKENPDTSIRNKEGFVYTNLLLKHLYFAVRHNDAEKVAKLLAAGADQFARVDGTEVNPREEAKRRGFYEILRQMASLAKKKPRPEEDKIIAIEDVFRLFEDDNSNEDGELSSSSTDDDQDMASCEEDLEDSDEEEGHVQEDEEEEFAYWKMSNAVCVLDAKEVFKGEEDSLWEHWDEKPKVIKARELFKEEEEAWWEEIENRPKVITVKQLLNEEQKPWWEDDDEEEDDDDSSRCEVISANEFFREDEEWWRDAVEDVDKNKGIPAKEYFKEDKPWWETEDDDKKPKVISAKEFFKDDNKPWWDDDDENEDKKEKVISAREFFKDDDKPWWLEEDAEEREENKGFKKRIGGLKKSFRAAQWPKGEKDEGSEDEWEEANDSVVHSGSTALLIPGGEKPGVEVPWWAKVNITRHIRRTLGQTSDSEGEGSSEESSEEGEEEVNSSDEEGMVYPLKSRLSGKEDKGKVNEVTRVLSARDLFKETPWWEEKRTEGRNDQNSESESESEETDSDDDIPVMPSVKLDYEMKASDMFKEEAWWDVSENSYSDEKEKNDDESELTEEFVSCDSRQKEDEDIERTDEISSGNFGDAQSEIDDDTDLTYEDLSSKLDEDYSSTNLDFDEEDDSLHSELDDEISTVINESHDSETMMKELDELAVLTSDSDVENPLGFESDSPKTVPQEINYNATPVNILETEKLCENKQETTTIVTNGPQSQQTQSDEPEDQIHTNEMVTTSHPRKRQNVTPSPRDELDTSLVHKNESKDTTNFTKESQTISPHVIPQGSHTQSIGRSNANKIPDDSNTKESTEKDNPKQEDEKRTTPQSKDQLSKTQSLAEDSSKVGDPLVSTSAVIITLESDSIVSTSMPGVVHSPVFIDKDVTPKAVSSCVKESETNPKSSNKLVFSSPFTSSDSTVLRQSHPQEDASQPHQREQEAERCPKDDDSGVKDLDITNKDEEHVANNSEAVYDATIEGKAQDTGTLAESNSHPVKSEVVTNKMVERMEKLNAALDRISMGKQGNGSPAAPTPKVTQSNEKTEMFSSLKSNSEPNLAVSDDNRKNAMDDCLAKVDASLAWLDKRLSRDAAYPPSPIDTSKTSSPAPSPATSEETLVPPSSHVVKGSVTLENSRGVAGSNALKTEGEPGKSSLRLIKVHVNIQERPLAQDTNTTESETDVEKKTSSVENTDDIRVAEEKDSPEILQKHSTMISEDNSSLQERPSSASGSQKAENSQLPSENNTLDEGVKRRYVSQVPHCPELETTEKSEQEEVNDLKTLSANPMTCKPESTGGKEALNQSSRTGGERKTESDQPATHIGETSQGSTKPEGESVHETVEIIQDSDGNQNKESLSAPGENDTASAEVRSKETTGTGTSSLEDENVTAKPEIKETGVQEAKKPSCEYEMALSRSPSPVRRIKKHDSMSPLNLSRENSIEKLFPLPRVAPQRTLWRCSTYDAMSLNDYDNIAAIINKSASFPANWKSVEDWKENFGSIESLNERGKSSSRPKKQENLVELEGNQSSEESDHSTEEESHASQKVGEEKHEERKNEKDGKIREKGDVEEKREVRVKIEEVQKHDKEGEERKVAVATEKTKEAETRDYKTKGEEIEIEVERKIREEIKPNEKSEEEEGEEEKVKTEEKCLNDKQNENIEKRETEDERIPEKEKETKLNKKVNAKKFEEEERKTREKTDGSKRETTDNVEDKRDPQDEEEKTDRNENNEIKKTGDRKETGETRTREFADNSKSENSPPVDAAECKETVNDSTQNLAPKMNITESQESKIAKTETQELSEEPKNIEEKVQEFKQKTLEVQSKIPVTEAVITQDTNEKPETTDRRIEEPECKIPEIKTEAIITENEAQVVEEKASILKNEVSVAEGQVLVSERESQLVEEKTQFVKNENEVVNNENRVTKNEIQAVKDNTMTTKDEVPLVECEVKHEIPLPKNDTPKVTTNTQIEENQAQEIYNENSDNRNLKAKNEAKQDVLTVDKDSQIIVNETTGGEYAKSVKDISIAEGEKQASSKESEINLEATAIPVKPPRGQKSEKSMNSNQTKKAESQTNPTTDPKHTGDTTQRRQDQTILKQIQENKPHGSQEEMQALGNSLQPQNQTQMLEKRSPKPQKHELSQTSKLSEPPELTQTIEKNQATPHESLSPQLQEQTQPQKQAQVPTTKILEPQKQTQAPSTKSAESQKQTQASTTKTPEHQKQTPTPTKKTLEPQKQSQAPARKSPEPQRQTQAPTVKTLEPQRQAQELTRKSPEPQKQSLIPKRKSPDPHSETTVRRSPDPRTETTVRKSPEPQNQTQKSTPPKKTPRTSKKKPSESKKQTQATASKSPDPESKPQTATKRSHDQISSSKSPSDPQNQPQTSTTKPPDPQNQTQPSTTKSHEPHKQTQKQSKTSTEPPKQSETQKRTQTRTSPEPQNQKQRRTSPESQNQAQTPTKKPTQQQKQAKSPVRKSTQQQKQVQGASKKPPQSPKQTQKQVKKGSQSQKQSQMSDKKPPNPASQVQVHEDKTNMSHTQAPVSELLGIQSHEKSSSHNLGEAQVQTQEKKLKSQIPRVQTQTSKSESLGTPVRTETPDNKKVEHSPKTPQPQPLNRAEMKRIPQQPDKTESHDHPGERRENEREQTSHTHHLESPQDQNKLQEEGEHSETPNKGQDFLSNTQVSDETKRQGDVNITHKATGTREQCTATTNTKVQITYDETGLARDKGFPSTDPQLSKTSDRSLENALNRKLTDPPAKPFKKGCPGGEEVTMVATKFCDDIGGILDSSSLSPTHEPVTTLAPPLVPQGTGDEKVMAAAEYKAELTTTTAPEVLVQSSNNDLLCNADRPEAAKVEGNTLSGLASPSRTPAESVKRSESQSENTGEFFVAGKKRGPIQKSSSCPIS
ncbi:uncharacterized protein LOC143027732 isoform X2 [Oratosquilla oratoria]|uniref:uncharacterized protein LOC143027732 isoform X2 n=1 Tax=Oratosquilla oratoria TaxID=337810 RepID=UPI003F7649A9